MAREYCCCAIPIVNFGIYLALVEQFVVGIVAGSLAVATPRVVSYSAPSFGPAIFAVACYVMAASQIFGFLGVANEKAEMFKHYTTAHGFLTLAAFSIAAVFIGISASQHTPATTACEAQFFATSDDPTGGSNGEGEVVCDIFAWVGIGVFAGLWIVMGVAQAYFFFVLTTYGSSQRADQAKYYSVANGGGDDILLADRHASKRGDPWDHRASSDSLAGYVPYNAAGVGASGGAGTGRAYDYSHARQDSSASTASAATLPGGGARVGYQPRSHSRQITLEQYSSADAHGYPIPALTADEHPTPIATTHPDTSRHERQGSIQRPVQLPQQSAFHPAEGSFGRKTPRIEGGPPSQPYPFAPEFQTSSSQGRLR